MVWIHAGELPELYCNPIEITMIGIELAGYENSIPYSFYKIKKLKNSKGMMENKKSIYERNVCDALLLKAILFTQ